MRYVTNVGNCDMVLLFEGTVCVGMYGEGFDINFVVIYGVQDRLWLHYA